MPEEKVKEESLESLIERNLREISNCSDDKVHVAFRLRALELAQRIVEHRNYLDIRNSGPSWLNPMSMIDFSKDPKAN